MVVEYHPQLATLVNTPPEGSAWLHEIKYDGYRFSKRKDQGHRSGRSAGWLKAKCVLRQEFVIGGFTEPSGSREGIGALLVGLYEDGR